MSNYTIVSTGSGKFAVITLSGNIVYICDTKQEAMDLLKGLQQ